MTSQHYYFRGTRNSLGEAYHVALHGILISAEESAFFGLIPDGDDHPDGVDKYAAKLFELLDDLEIRHWKNLNCSFEKGLSETANTIFERFHRDQILRKRKLIEAIAAREKWEMPFQTKFTSDSPKILIWLRNESHEPWRNSSYPFVSQLICLAKEWGLEPVIIGKWIFTEDKLADATYLDEFWKDSFFQKPHFYLRQLWFQHKLFDIYNVKASLGMMSGSIDGVAMFFGHKTIFFAREADAKPRMTKVASVVPGLVWFPIEYDIKDDKQIDRLSSHEAASLRSMIGC